MANLTEERSMAEPVPVRATEVAYILEQLRKNPKPNKKIKETIAKCEELLCVTVSGLQVNK
jgi:hypothetical protein